MKSYALMPLHSYQMKIVGAALSVVAIILILAVSFIDGLVLVPKFAKVQLELLLWINAMGLNFIAFSKERNEDERISLVRDRTFRSTLGMLLAMMFAASITDTLFTSHIQPVYLIQPFALILNITLIYHLLVFYIRLNTNAGVDVEEQTVLQNIRNNLKLYIIFLAINVVTLLLLLFL